MNNSSLSSSVARQGLIAQHQRRCSALELSSVATADDQQLAIGGPADPGAIAEAARLLTAAENPAKAAQAILMAAKEGIVDGQALLGQIRINSSISVISASCTASMCGRSKNVTRLVPTAAATWR